MATSTPRRVRQNHTYSNDGSREGEYRQSSSRKSWAGDRPSSSNWEEDPNFPHHPTGMLSSPQAQQRRSQASPRRNTRSSSRGSRPGERPSSDQLANLKNQWNAGRDIPSGTVRNNPFIPQNEPQNAPPQLMHQKKQWDTSGIPRGSVAARTMTMEGSPRHSTAGITSPRNSVEVAPTPKRSARVTSRQFEEGPTPQRSSARMPARVMSPSRAMYASDGPDAVKSRTRHSYAGSKTSSSNGSNSKNKGSTFSRSRLIENPVLTSTSSANATSRKWQPSREIPKGAVKGRVNMFGDTTPTRASGDNAFFKDEDEDPWIIPSQVSATSQVFPGDWGEAVAAKSSDTDDWEAPRDWFVTSESQTTNSSKEKSAKKKSYKNDGRVDLGMVDEKKLNEDVDPLEMARGNPQPKVSKGPTLPPPQQEDPFGTIHKRDAEILQAARDKAFFAERPKASVSDKKKLKSIRALATSPRYAGSSSPRALAPSPKDGMLYAASKTKKAGRHQKHSTKGFDSPMFQDSPQNASFDEDVFVDAKYSFKSIPEPQVFEESFGDFASPKGVFSDNGFSDDVFHEANESKSRKFNDSKPSSRSVASNAHSQQQQPDPVNETPRSGLGGFPSPPSHEDMGFVDLDDFDDDPAEPEHPKKQRKGLFKFFGGGRKDKDGKPKKEKTPKGGFRSPRSTPRKSSKDSALKESSLVSNASPSNIMRSSENKKKALLVDTTESEDQAERSSTENVPEVGHQHIKDAKSEDDTTVSDMTLPTVFKEAQMQKTLPQVLPTIESRDLASPSPASTYETVNASNTDGILLSRQEAKPDLESEQAATPKRAHYSNPRVSPEMDKRVETIQSKPILETAPADANAYSDPPLDHIMNDSDPALDHMDMDETENTDEEVMPPSQPTLEEAKPQSPLKPEEDRVSHSRKSPRHAQNFGPTGTPKQEKPNVQNFGPTGTPKQEKPKPESPKARSPNLPGPPSEVMSASKSESTSSGSHAFRKSPFQRRAAGSKPYPYASNKPKLNVAVEQEEPPTEEKIISPSAYGKQPIPRRAPKFVARHAKMKEQLSDTKRHARAKLREKARTQKALTVQAISVQTESRRQTAMQKFPKASKAFQQYGNEKTPTASLAVPRDRQSFSPSGRMPFSPGGKGRMSFSPGGSINFHHDRRSRDRNPESDEHDFAGTNDLVLNRMGIYEIMDRKAEDLSLRSHRSADSTSVGSDIRVLRSILRRPRRNPTPKNPVFVSNQVFPCYDEEKLTDPMQRAGLRLLSSAIIPIQTEVRRFIAMRRALTRMWALIVIQTYTRRWIERSKFLILREGVQKMQALHRGRDVRSELVYQHVCAIEIQRFVRGYIATMRVYEDIYKVTLIQSYVRMKSAVEQATHKMALIIQLQSVVRGFLIRQRIEFQEACAVAIQANWRCFFTRLTYQFDLLDIILVQSAWRKKVASRRTRQLRQHKRDVQDIIVVQSACRRKAAIRTTELLRKEKLDRAATTIQTNWRSYDCSMNYLHYLADVLIAQSAIRRYLAGKYVAEWKNDKAIVIQMAFHGYAARIRLGKLLAASRLQAVWRGYTEKKKLGEFYAARKIQSAWRGFVCYADYMFSIADIVVAQKVARKWLACRVADRLRYREVTDASTIIQRNWRNLMHSRRIQRAWRLHHFRQEREASAVMIQKNWRCFVDETEYVVMKYEYYAARTIQSYWRRFWCFSNYIIALDCSIQIQAVFRGYLQRRNLQHEHNSATAIQTVCRGYVARVEASEISMVKALLWAASYNAEKETDAAIVLQQNFRGGQARVAVKIYIAARKIQRIVRGKQARIAVSLYLSARTIQTVWRGYTPYRVYTAFIAARRIQTAWRKGRMHRAYTCYRAALRIQTIQRGNTTREKVSVYRAETVAATLIQTSWRRFISYTDYIFTVSDIICVQKIARAYVARYKYANLIKSNLIRRKIEDQASVKLQKSIRGHIARQKYWYVLGCTVQLQSWYRGRSAAQKVWRKERARLTLQCFFRRCLGRQEFLQRKFIYKLIQAAEEQRLEKLAAMLIQETWRCYLVLKRRDEAAQVIQRFFLMVKREVDRMIRATKQRRRWRKKMESRTMKVQDAILEDAWDTAVIHVKSDNDLPYAKVSSSKRTRASRSHRSKTSSTRREIKSRNRLSSRTPNRPSTIVEVTRKDSDDNTEFSGLTASTAGFMKAPIPRSRKLDSLELDQDLELEEAYIDAEIFSAKERRKQLGSPRSTSVAETTLSKRKGTSRVNVVNTNM